MTEREERLELAEWARATAPLFSAYAGKYERIAQILESAVQPEYLSGCQLRGPGECQKEGKCMSVACNHYGKTECRPRMTLLAQVGGVLYPEKTIPTSGLNDVNETTANYARRKELKP